MIKIKLFSAKFGKPEGPIIVSLFADTGCENTSKHSAQLLSGHFNHHLPTQWTFCVCYKLFVFVRNPFNFVAGKIRTRKW